MAAKPPEDLLCWCFAELPEPLNPLREHGNALKTTTPAILTLRDNAIVGAEPCSAIPFPPCVPWLRQFRSFMLLLRLQNLSDAIVGTDEMHLRLAIGRLRRRGANLLAQRRERAS